MCLFESVIELQVVVLPNALSGWSVLSSGKCPKAILARKGTKEGKGDGVRGGLCIVDESTEVL